LATKNRSVSVKKNNSYTKPDFENRFSDACIGLVYAARKYDPDLGSEETYAWHWCRAEILGGIRGDRAVHLPFREYHVAFSLMRKIDDPAEQLAAIKKAYPGMSDDSIDRCREIAAGKFSTFVQLDEIFKGDLNASTSTKRTNQEVYLEEKTTPEDQIVLARAVEAWYNTLTEFETEIVSDRLEQVSLEKSAAKYGKTKQWVWLVWKRVVNRLHVILEG